MSRWTARLFDAMRARMIAKFAVVRQQMDAVMAFARDEHHLLGTSGTVTTLAAVSMGLERYLRSPRRWKLA
ncbi:MAG: hypothetical protein WDM89_14450 [Rhizomicrobium sp.]